MSELHRNSPAEGDDERLGTVHENLEGWIPAVSTEAEIRAALEKAFDYRGDLTITLKNGRKIEGYVFDRRMKGPALSECFVRVMPKDSAEKLSLPYSEIAALTFSGRDTAAGKSFAAWVKKYNEKKAAGETNVGIESDPLD
ncbi:MAG TPA: hypothetical protein VJO53_12305 [Candidatus Acidoferrales bacterium]|nr:hypothetical protein [Candidatus Acidoferrales bacterium]